MDSKQNNQISRNLEEIFEKLNDPVEQERRRIKKNREKRSEEIKKDLGI